MTNRPEHVLKLLIVHLFRSTMSNKPTLVYMSEDPHRRVCWYRPESTQLHYEKLQNVYDLDTGAEYQDWYEKDVKTLEKLPSEMKEMLKEMEEYYQYCMDMEIEARYALM